MISGKINSLGWQCEARAAILHYLHDLQKKLFLDFEEHVHVSKFSART